MNVMSRSLADRSFPPWDATEDARRQGSGANRLYLPSASFPEAWGENGWFGAQRTNRPRPLPGCLLSNGRCTSGF